MINLDDVLDMCAHTGGCGGGAGAAFSGVSYKPGQARGAAFPFRTGTRPMRVSTTTARDHLSEIITRVQDPRAYCILTRHGKPVAAIVSVAEMKRIWSDQDIEDVASGKKTPAKFIFGRGSHATNAEAAQAILKVQMDRRMEREVLARAGKDPVPGGEVEVEAEVARSRWQWVRRARKLVRWTRSGAGRGEPGG